VELIDIKHRNEEVPAFEPDLFIAASGYESRATCIPKYLNDPGKKNVVLAFSDHLKEPARAENDRYFREHGYQSLLVKPFGQPDFMSIFQGHDEDHIRVLIDITLMTRRWYDSFLNYLNGNDSFQKADVRISYCPAHFYKPVEYRRKVSLRQFTLNGSHSNHVKQHKKTALIMGLGNDKGVGKSVYDLVKPDHMLLLYADPAVHKSYVENIFINNHSIIKKVDIQNLVHYPLRDTAELYKTFLEMILPLREEYNVVIVPQGPKIFSLLSMVFHLNYPDVTVSYPEYKVKGASDKKSSADHISLDLEFAAD